MREGTRLGPYEIHARIGAGGMGEVWKATDTRLGRDVAVKILPADFGSNAQLRTRFEREARTISQLHHPHICTLFDVGENFLVMELLEGETVAERLARGPLPISDVLRYGAQVADALDKAHRQGVIHRDLKPANVMITKSGAKLLDFGLAKAAVLEVNFDGATEHRPLTQEGTILGTFQYMSPEQLEGQNVDHRSDIFALGTLLYEMATGRRAFDGKTKTSLIAAIVSVEPPPLSQIQPLTPPALEHVIRKCLAKDPEERWQSAHDIAEELRWIGDQGSQAGVAAPVVAARRLRRGMLVSAAVAGWLLALLGGYGAWKLWKRADAAERPMFVELAAPIDVTPVPVAAGPAVLSPDGSRVAYVITGSSGGLRIRDLTTGVTSSIEGTETAGFPFWSPDGESVGFFAMGKLKITRAAGGGIQTLADAKAGRGGAWSPRGVIVFAPDIDSPLMRVSIDGGPATAVTRARAVRESHRNPVFLGDGERFLYTARTQSEDVARVMAGSLAGGLAKQVLEAGSNVSLHDGLILFYRGGNVVAQRLDERTLSVSGTPVPVAAGVEYFNARDVANFSISRTGTLLFRRATARIAHPTWVARDGKVLGPAGPEADYRVARISPDGQKILFSRTDPRSGKDDLWITDTVRGTSTKVTFEDANLIFGSFSPDGTRLVASRSLMRGAGLVWTQPLAGGTKQVVYRGEEAFMVWQWSRDGRHVVGSIQRGKTGFDLACLDIVTGALTILFSGEADENNPALSPDEKLIAFNSNESGTGEVYVTTYPDLSRKWQISDGGGNSPGWTQDGTEVVYFTGAKVMSAPVRRAGESWEFGAPQPLPIDAGPTTARAVAADGRVLLVKAEPARTPFTLVTNWRRTLAHDGATP